MGKKGVTVTTGAYIYSLRNTYTARNTRTLYQKDVMCLSLQKKKPSYFLHTTDDVNQLCDAYNLWLISFSYLKRLCLRRNISSIIYMCPHFLCSYVFMKGRVLLVLKKFTWFLISDWSRQRVLNDLGRARISYGCIIWLLAHPPPLPSVLETQEDWEKETICSRERV